MSEIIDQTTTEMKQEMRDLRPILLTAGQRCRADLTDEDRKELFDQYKLMIQSNDQLLLRKQTLNSFFLSLNSAIMAGIGLVGKEVATAKHPFDLFLLLVLIPLAGFVLCWHWAALLRSHGRMLKAKQEVMMLLEEYLVAAMIKAESMALGEKRLSIGKSERNITVIFRFIYMCMSLASFTAVLHTLVPSMYWP